MLSPLKLVVAFCALGATATEFKCWKTTYFNGPVTGVLTLTNQWQKAIDCGSAKWTSSGNNNRCIWIRGSKGSKGWNIRTKDPPVDIFRDVGYNSQVKEDKC